jgi:hypothetical protein
VGISGGIATAFSCPASCRSSTWEMPLVVGPSTERNVVGGSSTATRTYLHDSIASAPRPELPWVAAIATAALLRLFLALLKGAVSANRRLCGFIRGGHALAVKSAQYQHRAEPLCLHATFNGPRVQL